ncbi:MAG: hypothetical protein WD823_04530 [Sulfuricaulis sp.]|uniref:hypothetical protein n=1 Tax=Sulfuricaulis sp. TaxID=2003553 RepID=UPI0034A1025A
MVPQLEQDVRKTINNLLVQTGWQVQDIERVNFTAARGGAILRKLVVCSSSIECDPVGWARIEEAEGRYLRVVLLPDGETVHNAFFDRGHKP